MTNTNGNDAITVAHAYKRKHRKFIARAYATVRGAKCARVVAFGDTREVAEKFAIAYCARVFENDGLPVPEIRHNAGRVAVALLYAYAF